jgi:hypothetical protein
MREIGNAYKYLFSGEPEGKRPAEKYRCRPRWKDNIKMVLK